MNKDANNLIIAGLIAIVVLVFGLRWSMEAHVPETCHDEVEVMDKQGSSAWRTPDGWKHAGIMPDGYPLIVKEVCK